MIKFSLSPMIRLQTEEEIYKALQQKQNLSDHLPSIGEFYANREIFITGGRYVTQKKGI
jgi:hypothetical protein